MIVGAVSDIGLRRENNQDCMFASLESDFPLFVVADGMGGHKAGDVASFMAVEGIQKYFRDNKERLVTEDGIKRVIKEAIVDVNDKIYLKSLEIPEYNGMGTTITMAYISNSKIFIGHVGDSRAYLIRDNKIKQLTEDHSYVNELIKKGTITPYEAENHPQRNMITRAVGTSIKISLDFHCISYELNDKLILCSDGLTNMVDEDTILRTIEKYNSQDMRKICDDLVIQAKDNGGRDNITVVGINLDNEVLI
jgi:protein phosphatase